MFEELSFRTDWTKEAETGPVTLFLPPDIVISLCEIEMKMKKSGLNWFFSLKKIPPPGTTLWLPLASNFPTIFTFIFFL